MAWKNKEGFTVWGRDKNNNTVWIPFPKELIKSNAIIRVSRTKYSNGNIVWSVDYYNGPIGEYKEYMNNHVVTFTLGENDVNVMGRVNDLKEKAKNLTHQLKEFIEVE